MILALVLMQAAPDAATLLDTRFRASLRDGGQCRVTRSTGDPAIDAVGCRAIVTCDPQFRSRQQATNDRDIRPEVKRMMRAALDAERASCIASERTAGLAALAGGTPR